MKPQELRIGNILNWQVGTSVQQGVVTSVSTTTIVIDHKSNFKENQGSSYRLIPIPLTVERLLKFGFKHQGGYLWKCKGLGEQRFIENHLTRAYFETFYHSHHIEYVHQLQNFYFAATDQELTEL